MNPRSSAWEADALPLCYARPFANIIKSFDILEAFIDHRKATKGLTESGEFWLREVLTTALHYLPSVEQIEQRHLVEFLGRYQNKPYRRHSFYRAFKSFWKWVSMTYDMPNPMLDRHGNPVIEAPKVPTKVMYTMTPDKVKKLIEAASEARDKAIIALLADSGARRGEIVSIKVRDVLWQQNRILVTGKGDKQGWLLFGDNTKALLEAYVNEACPTDSLFGLSGERIRHMLNRLEAKTGIKCNAHSFRRGYATQLRLQGVNEMDIMELGRWSSVEMVRRYTRAYTFDEAAKHYKPMV